MKKLLALLLAVIMVISMAACAPADAGDTTANKPADTTAANNDTTAAATTTEAEITPWNTYDCFDLTGIVEDDTIVIGLCEKTGIIDWETNDLTVYMEELTGLDIKFEFFSSDYAEAIQQLNLMLADGQQLPDVIHMICNPTVQADWGAQGLLCDITDFLKRSPRVTAVLDSLTQYQRDYFWAYMPDPVTGEIYAVPSIDVSQGPDNTDWMGGLNQTVAKALGMDANEIDTIAELEAYLRGAIAYDMNGNGQKDEIGLLYRTAAWRGNGEMWLINAFIYCCDEYLFNVEDGEVYMPYNTDEYRQAMILMNKWHKEGLIAELSYTVAGNNEMKELINKGTGNYITPAFTCHPVLTVNEDEPIGLEYVRLNTLADETGKGGYGGLLDSFVIDKGNVIPMNEEEPERMELGYLWCDIMLVDRIHKIFRYGMEGKNWNYIDGEALGLKDSGGDWAGFEIIKDPISSQHNDCWGMDPIHAWTPGMYEAGLVCGGVPANWDAAHRNNLAYGCVPEKLEHGTPEEVIYSLVYTADEQEVIDEYKNLYKGFMKEARAKFVTGLLDPNNDADWAQYLNELKLNGEAELLEVAQSAYDRMSG